MAALQVRENVNTGKMILEPSLRSRLGSFVFGLIWLSLLAAFLLPSLRSAQVNWLEIILTLFFGFIPFAIAFLVPLVTSSIVLDRQQRTITRAKKFLGVSLEMKHYAFADVQQIELRGYSPTKQAQTWMVSAALRDGKRVPLNWQGTDDEMKRLAQKISEWVGVRWTQASLDLPPALKQVIEHIAPEEARAMEQLAETTNAAEVAIVNEAVPNRGGENSTDLATPYALARQYHARGKLEQAIESYQAFLKTEPTNAEAQNDLGAAWHVRGKRAEAEAAYRRAIALDPFSFNAHLNLALLLSALNRAVEASQEFNHARRNARGDEETRIAEAASTGTRMQPRLSSTN